MAKLTNKGTGGLGLPRRSRYGELVLAFVLHAGESVTVPDWYVDELADEEGPRARLERGELAVAEDERDERRDRDEEKRERKLERDAQREREAFEAEQARRAREAETSSGGLRDELVLAGTLASLAIPKAGPIIAEETDLEVLERWRAGDERTTVHRLIDDRLSELSEPTG